MQPLVEPKIRPLSDREFRRFQRLIHGAAGIVLSDAKRTLIPGRLNRRLRALGLSDYVSYLELVERDGEERTRMLDCICTNETRFFREPRQFDFLDQDVLPRWSELAGRNAVPKRIRAWSAACSTGEEAVSIAMLLQTHFGAAGWKVEILASDLSTRALSTAAAGIWSIDRAGDIPADYRRAYMLRGVRGAAGTMRARPEVLQLIEFRQINLIERTYPIHGQFDLIFCRNVLIYFDQETKAAVIERLARYLAPDGLLLLGHAETITAPPPGLQHAGPTAYRRVS